MDFAAAEDLVQTGVGWPRLFAETLGALVITAGMVNAVLGPLRHALQRPHNTS